MTADILLASIVRGEPVDWPAGGDAGDALLIERAMLHGVAPLVARKVAERPENGWPASLVDRLRVIEAEAGAVAILRERELTRVLERLVLANVHPVIIKGAALAQTHYQAPHLRPSFDVDLFIDLEAIGEACRALEDLDYRRSHLVGGDLIMPQVSFERRDAHGLRHICDVHWRLARPQAFARALTYRELSDFAVPLPALGRHARGAGDIHALLAACVHRVAHHNNELRLIWLYDIHLLTTGLDRSSIDRFVELARLKGVSGVCANGLAAARQWIGTSLPVGLLEELEEHSLASWEESRAFIGGRTNLGVLLSDLRLVARWRDRLRLLKQHVFPSPAYMFKTYDTSSRGLLPALYTRRLVGGAWKWLRQSL